MKKDRKSLIAYAAGIMDGEGCFTIWGGKRYNSRSHRRFACRISVGNTNGKILDLLYGLFGGSIRTKSNKDPKTEQYRNELIWELSSSKAKKACKLMLPFLRAKRKQAELLIRFQTRLEVFKKRCRKAKKRWVLSEHEIEQREKLRLAMIEANKTKIVLPSAGVSTKQAARLQEYFKKRLYQEAEGR